ncbi:unnamed protein product [Rotaria sp. Silwood1]|nr:unnamed protein product [Rotaria sp. Silwood1]CAF4914493.1 unnamed protein product [Rotaria sp. Silwood1]
MNQLNTNLTQYPSSIIGETSSDGYYLRPCGYLLNTQGQQIINLSLTKPFDIVKQLRIHFYKPTDHDTIGLQQISIQGSYTYDQQMFIEQTSHPYQILISTIYVANKGDPTRLGIFVRANGLKILAKHFARYDPSIQSYDERLTSSPSTTTVQQPNTINNNNNTNSNPWANGTGWGTGSTHSQWKPDEIIQM